jgi:hypothetical protein
VGLGEGMITTIPLLYGRRNTLKRCGLEGYWCLVFSDDGSFHRHLNVYEADFVNSAIAATEEMYGAV